jgi:hypothetical protein
MTFIVNYFQRRKYHRLFYYGPSAAPPSPKSHDAARGLESRRGHLDRDIDGHSAESAVGIATGFWHSRLEDLFLQFGGPS